MNKWSKWSIWSNYAVFPLVIISIIQFVLLCWVLSFLWSDSYKGTTVLVDAISLQISILETMFATVLAVGGIILAFLGIWGYQKIRKSIDDRIETLTEDKLGDLIRAEMDKSNELSAKQESVGNVSTEDKDKQG